MLGKMILMQPCAQGGSDHTFYLFAMFDFAKQ